MTTEVLVSDEAFSRREAHSIESLPVEQLTEEGETYDFRTREVWLRDTHAVNSWEVMAGRREWAPSR